MINVLITRPMSSAISLADKIKATLPHIHPIVFPAVEIKAIEKNPFSNIYFASVDGIIFVSPAAVEKVKSYLAHLPSHIHLYAPGKDTAEKIQQSGLGKALYPKENFNSEALLQINELQHIEKKCFLICKGVGGSPHLTETLTARGALVKEIIVYERQLPHPQTLPDLHNIDVVICTSGESLQNLLTLLGEPFKEKRLLVSSEKLQQLAHNLGFQLPALLAKNAGDEAVMESLCYISSTLFTNEGQRHGKHPSHSD